MVGWSGQTKSDQPFRYREQPTTQRTARTKNAGVEDFVFGKLQRKSWWLGWSHGGVDNTAPPSSLFAFVQHFGNGRPLRLPDRLKSLSDSSAEKIPAGKIAPCTGVSSSLRPSATGVVVSRVHRIALMAQESDKR